MPRLIQLTDCHLFADPAQTLRGVATWPRFVAALADIRRQVPEFDLLVLSGDTAHDENLATYRAVRRELADWIDRVRIVPGNHDDRGSLRDVFPQAGGDVAGRVTFHQRWDAWQAIGLDSQRPGELAGSLGEEQLAWLRGWLAESPPLSTLLFLHHPPVLVQSPWLDEIGLRDAAELERVARDHPQVRLIACGHVHQELTAALGGATVFSTPAVGPQFRPRTATLEIDPGPPAYRVLELAADGTWSTQVLRCTAE